MQPSRQKDNIPSMRAVARESCALTTYGTAVNDPAKANKAFAHELSSSGVPVNQFRRKGGNTYCNVFGSFFFRAAVLNPLAFFHQY